MFLSDINSLVEEVCKEYIGRFDQSKLILKVIFVVDINSDNFLRTYHLLKY